jgi:hypothetical protein
MRRVGGDGDARPTATEGVETQAARRNGNTCPPRSRERIWYYIPQLNLLVHLFYAQSGAFVKMADRFFSARVTAGPKSRFRLRAAARKK